MKVEIGQRLLCRRCGKEWNARQTEVRLCPDCKSAYWDTPKVVTEITQDILKNLPQEAARKANGKKAARAVNAWGHRNRDPKPKGGKA